MFGFIIFEDPARLGKPDVIPIVRTAVIALTWGVMMAVSAAWSLAVDFERAPDSQLLALLAIYFAGACAAVPTAIPVALRLTNGWGRPWRLVVLSIVLAVATLLLTAALLALEHRSYFAQWHDPVFSRAWFVQQFYTAVGSTYQYAVIGTRHYLPLGPIFLFAVSWHLTRLSR